jgi:hypothetical protein
MHPPPDVGVGQSRPVRSSAKAEFQKAAACLDASKRTKLLDLFLEKRSELPADEFVNDLIEAVDDLNRVGKHDEAARLIQPVLTLSLPGPLRESLAARLRETENSRNAVEAQDRAMYEKIREVDITEREDRIVDYLKTAPRKYMGAEVESYREWLKTAPTIEILEVQPPQPHSGYPMGSCSVTVQVGHRSFTFHRVPTARPLPSGLYRVDLGALERAPWKWDKQIGFTVLLDDYNQCSAFTGNCQLRLGSQVEGQRISLTSRSGLVGSRELHVRFRMPEPVDVPVLPPWAKKHDEQDVLDRRNSTSR